MIYIPNDATGITDLRLQINMNHDQSQRKKSYFELFLFFGSEKDLKLLALCGERLEI